MPRDLPVIRVGLLVAVGLSVAGAAIFLIGEKDLLFARKNRYFIELASVNNLVAGNPVQLNGVVVGRVEDIILPEDMGETQLQIWISVDRRYAPRIREDSEAQILTLGLLGDRYISISSGTPAYPEIEPGGQITAAPTTEIDQLLSSGGDVVDNLVVAASSLSNILSRMEQGEGLLGLLVTEPAEGPSVSQSVAEILEGVRDVVAGIRNGEGSLGHLVQDDELAIQLEQTVTDVQSLLAQFDTGEGLLPRLMNDAELAERFNEAITDLEVVTTNLGDVATQMSEGDGLIPRLVNDQQLADELTSEMRQLLERLNSASEKLTSGDGTVAMLLNDPAVFEALNDILVGINDSKILRWLVRDRQKSGIRQRYESELEELDELKELE